MRCFLKIKFVDIRLISLEHVIYIYIFIYVIYIYKTYIYNIYMTCSNEMSRMSATTTKYIYIYIYMSDSLPIILFRGKYKNSTLNKQVCVLAVTSKQQGK